MKLAEQTQFTIQKTICHCAGLTFEEWDDIDREICRSRLEIMAGGDIEDVNPSCWNCDRGAAYAKLLGISYTSIPLTDPQLIDE